MLPYQMKKQTGFFHWLCIVIAAILLFVSLTLTAASAALFFKGQKTEDLKTSATKDLIFQEVLSGEDQDLVASLEQIPAFQAAQTRYAESLIDWRYSNGSDWTGLSDEESRQIAHELLLKTLEKEPIDEGTDEIDYAETVEENEKALMNPLQNLFPSFQTVMSAKLIRHLDSAASLVTGRVFIIFCFVSLVLLAVLFLFCRGFAEHSMPIAVTLILASAVCFVLAVRTDMFGLFSRFYPDYNLLQTPTDSKTGFLALWALAYLVLSIPFVILSIRHLSFAQEKTPSAESVPQPAAAFAASVPRSFNPEENDAYQYGDETPTVTVTVTVTDTVTDTVPVQDKLPEQTVIPAAEADKEITEDISAVQAETIIETVPEADYEEETIEESDSDITAEPEAADIESEEAAVESDEEETQEEPAPVTDSETVSSAETPDNEEPDEEAPEEDSVAETEETLPSDEVPAEEVVPEDEPEIENELPFTEGSEEEKPPVDMPEQEDVLPVADSEETAEDTAVPASSSEEALEPETPAVEDLSETASVNDIPSDEFYMHPGHLYEKAHSLSALEADASYDDGDFMSDLPLL